MEKTRINLDILLPEVPDARDACVSRIIKTVSSRRGIDKVHIIPETPESKALLCFHYNPDEISLEKVQKLAGDAGSEITKRYGHLLLEVKGIRHVRHARVIELNLKGTLGIMTASASASGWITIEYDHHATTPQSIFVTVNTLGLNIIAPGVQFVSVHTHDDTKEESNEEHAGQEQEQDNHEGHNHSHGGIFGERTELIFAIICGALLAIGFGVSFLNGVSEYISIGFYIGAYLFGGFYTTKEAIQGISKGEFEIDFLMLVAAIGAACLGQWAEGALLLFLFSLGHSLEHYALEKAKKSISALANLAPKTALLKVDNDVKEVKIESLRTNDIIVVKPNSKISADGIVVKGSSSVNQAPITGESIPVDKTAVTDSNINLNDADSLDAKYRVFAGSINGSEALEIKVTKVAANSTIARLVKLVNEAQTQKSPTQNFTDKLEK